MGPSLRTRFVPALSLAVAVLLPEAASPQSTPAPTTAGRLSVHEMRCGAAVVTPDDLAFTIATPDGRTRFHQGEIVRLTLAFSSRRRGAYWLETADYGRSPAIDTVCVEPAGSTVEPLRDYFSAFGVVGSILGGSQELADAPVRLWLDVNEGHRFLRPGRHRVSVRSAHVATAPHEVGWNRGVAVSNTVEIEILSPAPPLSPEQLTRATPRVLRYLDTQQAAGEMARRLLHDLGGAGRIGTAAFHHRHGLLASPHRAFVVRHMERLLESAIGEVSEAYVQTLAELSALLVQPVNGVETSDRWDRRNAAFEEARRRYMERAREAFARSRRPQ